MTGLAVLAFIVASVTPSANFAASKIVRRDALLRLSGGAAQQTVLVTGGVGYIGSHTVLELLNAGYDVVVADNLCNSNIECLHRVQVLAGRDVEFYQVDIREKAGLAAVFAKHKIDAVIHFAGLKAVGESVAKPLLYYQVNVEGTLNLVEVMNEAGCHNIVFSSSATVYGDPASVPVTEDFPTGPTNPYGQSKLMNEIILGDVAASDKRWNVCLLRYFNPVGAHPSGQIGEDPKGIPNNLMPFIQQVAVGKRPKLSVFGSDYPTADGTGVRDYIHVVDLAKGHVKAVAWLAKRVAGGNGGMEVINLGTGQAISVLEMVKAFEVASGKKIPYKLGPRRQGDVPAVWADPAKALTLLGWRAELGLADMCRVRARACARGAAAGAAGGGWGQD
jgi:UDP-glucose 4-epimerase